MDACKATMLLALLIAASTVTEAMNYLALPRMGRSGYLAFPRMGRKGYFAFPRMGRTQPSQDGVDCCLTGLKVEWVPQEGGTTSPQSVCGADACCPGLREILGQKPDGVFYAMCVPGTAAAASGDDDDQKAEGTSRDVLQKLNELLRN